jgi:hypothetical protein
MIEIPEIISSQLMDMSRVELELITADTEERKRRIMTDEAMVEFQRKCQKVEDDTFNIA